MSRFVQTVALLSLLGLACPSRGENDRRAETRELIVCGAEKPLFVRLHIRVDRAGYREKWEANIDQLFSELDRDGNAGLDADEARRMPTVQQFQGRRFNPFIGMQRPKRPQAADRDKDGKVTRGEFVRYIREAGGGEFAAQTRPDANGQSPAVDAAIFKRLDSNRDGVLQASEFGLSDSLRKLDTDDDETISLAELAPLLFSPYASNLQQPTPGSDRVHDLSAVASVGDVAKSLLDRYAERSGDSSQEHIRLDRLGDEKTFGSYDSNQDGLLDNNEVMGLVKDPPMVAELTVWMGSKEKAPRVTHFSPAEKAAQGFNEAQAVFAGAIRSLVQNVMPGRSQQTESTPLTVDLETDRIDFAVDTPLNRYQANNVSIYKQQFSAADRDNNKYLSKMECQRNGFLSGAFNQMDADGDGKVFELELVKFVEEQERFAATRTFVSVTDQGHNLFGTFDTNRDGRLTQRELMNGVRHIDQWDSDGDGAVALSEIPSQIKLTFSQGTSNPFGVVYRRPFMQMTTARPTLLAPSWFRKMDRNRDGDLSPREFLGPKADFAKLDTNNDGLVSADEARKGL